MNSYLAGDRGIILTQVKRKIHPTVSVAGVRWGRRGKTSAEGIGTRVSGLMVTILRPGGCGESSGAIITLGTPCMRGRRKEKNDVHHPQHLAVLTGQTHMGCGLVMRGGNSRRMKSHPAAD